MIYRLLKPNRFLGIVNASFPWILMLTILFIIIGLYYALINSPHDYQQGVMVRMMYIHVPSAWMSLLIYSIMAVSSLCYIIWRSPISNIISHSSAPIGCIFTLITLLTGSIWGKPIWGTWWVWDARLTSMLILFLFYLGYLSLSASVNEVDSNSLAPSILAIVGFINIPIVKFSVNLWNSLHQPASIIRIGGPSIDPSMMKPLFIMFLASIFYFFTNLIIRIKIAIIIKKIKRLEFQD